MTLKGVKKKRSSLSYFEKIINLKAKCTQLTVLQLVSFFLIEGWVTIPGLLLAILL